MNLIVANESHFKYAEVICDTIADSAKVRGTGIAKRTPEYIQKKLLFFHVHQFLLFLFLPYQSLISIH